MYMDGRGVPQDYKQAVAWYRKAAEQGDAFAQTNLGVMYSDGQGVPQDYQQAVAWYRKAAEQGHAVAQTNLGVMYSSGQGVPQDYQQAVAWFRKAAEQGHASAQTGLGLRYMNGQGVPQDYQQAVAWFRKAAEQGHANAQNNLGAMYMDGQGVPANRVIAYALFNLSGTNSATENRARVTTSMSAQEVSAGQALTRELGKPGNLLKALDTYSKNPTIKEKPKALAAVPAQQVSDDPFPNRPNKIPGRVSCNTRCLNATCWRTYDDGKKVRFQAQRKYDAISGEWKFDSGGC
jgi:alpha/beta superfamily hydrolase